MSKPNPYINTFYLAVHLALNILVVVLVIDVIDAFVPVKHLFAGYFKQIDLRLVYPPTTLEKNIAAVVALGAAIWYYQRRKTKNGDHPEKYHFPNLREVEEFFRSKFN